MIKVTYHPIDSDATTSESETLAQWFVDQFGEKLNIPKGLVITYGQPNRSNDVTQEISLGDPNNHLNRITGEYHVLETPGTAETWIPLIISLVVSVAAVLLAPKPQVPNASNSRQDSATNSLGNRTNDARPGERCQDVRGFEPAVYADLLMTPHRRYESNREVEYLWGTVTTGKGLVSDPRDGITDWTSLVGSSLNIYLPGTYPNGIFDPSQEFNGRISFPVVSATQSRNINGQQLAPPNQLETEGIVYVSRSSGQIEAVETPEEFDFRNLVEVGDTITLVDWFAWEYVGEEPYQGLAGTGGDFSAYLKRDTSGDYEVTAVTEKSVYVQIKDYWWTFGAGDGFTMRTVAFKKNGTNFYYIDSDASPGFSTQWTKEIYYPAVQGIFDGTIGPFRVPDGSEGGWVNLLARNGIRKAGKADYAYSVTCQFTLYELDANGDRTGSSTVLDEVTLESNPVLITDQVGETQDFDIPYFYCEISGQRTSPTDKNFNGTVVDEVQWVGLFTTEPTGSFAPEDTTTAYAKIVQTPNAVAAQERKLNFGVTRYERAYLGNGAMSETEDTPSDEFADAVVGLALDKYVGKNVTLEQLNIDSLYAVQEEIAAYFGTRNAVKFGYSFSTSDMTFEDHLRLIARAVFCRVFRIGNSYEFRFDRPRAKGETALVLNHRLKYANTDKRQRMFVDMDRKNYDGVVFTYKSAETLAFETVRIPEGVFAVNPYEEEISGVTDEQVAKWHALREWNKIRYKRLFHETQAHSLARGLVPGDRIVMGNDTLTRSLNGQVLEQQGLELRLANGIRLEEGVTYSITLMYKSGTVENILCSRGSIGDQWVQLFALPAEDLYTGNLEWRTTYNLYEATEADKDDMLVESMKVSIKNGQERITVQAVNYDVRYWSGDPQSTSNGSFSSAFSDAFDKGITP